MILNLTQHDPTPEQIAAGVTNPAENYKREIRRLLTFDTIPLYEDIVARANALAAIATEVLQNTQIGHRFAMIGGAPFLMSELEKALLREAITPLYAFTRRVTQERHREDGTVEKVAVFKHKGFVAKVR